MRDLLISFVNVFAAMSPWLVVGFLAAGVIAVWIPRSWVNLFIDASGAVEAACCASHGLTAVHWICAAFLAVMMAYNLIRPVGMSHASK